MMKLLYVKVVLCLALVPFVGLAQDVELDPGLFDDESLMLDAEYSDPSHQTRAVEPALPAYVNNAETKYFPPVFNQAGGSCSAASRIGYMFTHEMNAYRGVDGSLLENRYPTHFVWLMENGNSGKYAFVQQVGVPNAKVYGGITYSHRFGNQTAFQNNFGWMQGYDKWYSGMFNKMLMPTHLPSLKTEEGRVALKRWLYNHNGDRDFSCGGIAGVGVGINGKWGQIPQTPANDDCHVSGKKYVKSWGNTFNHALTIVGYDDRIEFDLNGNNIFGEESADEKGAWIIVNSWGKKFANNGFIYCPYANAVKTLTGASNGASWWFPEILRVRKNYRPLRTLKVKMDYSHRSEICLTVGVSADLNATVPDKMITLAHFEYAGDGHNGKTNPAPAIPMLGKWTDGLHTEPMEFGYDLTDLSADFNTSVPLKYFFMVNSRDWAKGAGKIYNASIIDYEFNESGVEVPFEIQPDGVDVRNQEKTPVVLSTIVCGENYLEPQNVALVNGGMIWNAPMVTAHTVVGYNIYGDDILLNTSPVKECKWDMSSPGGVNVYSVSAVYEHNVESARASIGVPVHNQAVQLNHSGFTIPDLFDKTYQQATIEFWLRPHSLVDFNQGGGPGWKNFKFHSNHAGTFVVGWDETDRITEQNVFTVNTWTHIAFVVDHNKITLYKNGALVQSLVSSKPLNTGIGGFGKFDFGSKELEKSIDGEMAEIRIWNVARTEEQIKANYKVEYTGSILPNGLLAYYKGGICVEQNKTCLIDYAGKHFAPVLNQNIQTVTHNLTFSKPVLGGDPILGISVPSQPIHCGLPVTFSANYPEGVDNLCWDADNKKYYTSEPAIAFDKPGTHVVALSAILPDGNTINTQTEVTVEMAPEPVATFKASKQNISPNESVTFVADQPLLGYKYEWDMPGAETESSSSPNACTSYAIVGTYVVRLTVTSPDGQIKTSESEIAVNEQTPIADFDLAPSVVMKGETVSFDDKSKNTPTKWTWLLANDKKTYKVAGQHTAVVPTIPGVYDVTLSVENGKGTDSKILPRGLTVCNANSENGLFFANDNESVCLIKPVLGESSQKEVTLDWWMNPSVLKKGCNGFGQSGTFLLSTNAKGGMTLEIAGNRYSSGEHFVIASEWHHYGVVVARNQVVFYRDGVSFKSVTLDQPVTLNGVTSFTLGGAAAPISGQIDEFRIWNSALTQEVLQQYANQPIDNIAEAKLQHKLSVYFDFNQSGGNVIDRTGNGCDGERIGFGPDGDAWGFSQGVFCLNLMGADEDVYALHLREGGYYTLYLPYACVIPQGVTAYVAEGVENNIVKLVAVAKAGEVLAKDMPVILDVEAIQNNETKIYRFEPATEMGLSAQRNLLKGSPLNQYVAPENDHKAYVMGLHEGEVKMLRAMLNKNSSGLPGNTHFLNRANKAYLEVPETVTANVQALRLGVMDETTGVESLKSLKNSERVYDLQGRRVLKVVTPGVYIMDGKLYYVK